MPNMQGNRTQHIQGEIKSSTERIVLDADVCLSKGISLFFNTKIGKNKNGSLAICGYRKTKANIVAGDIADYIWASLVRLQSAETRMTFAQWQKEYHADMIFLSKCKGDLKKKITYEEFRAEVVKCVFVFKPIVNYHGGAKGKI